MIAGRAEGERRGNVFRVRATAYGFIRVGRVYARPVESPPVTLSRRLRNLIKALGGAREVPSSERAIPRAVAVSFRLEITVTCDASHRPNLYTFLPFPGRSPGNTLKSCPLAAILPANLQRQHPLGEDIAEARYSPGRF